jgi:spore germination cell wall hydrolase CwlJ-like protein
MLCNVLYNIQNKHINIGNSEEIIEQSYKQAEMVAYQTMMGMYKDVVPKTTLFFHSINIDPSWPYKQVAKIGNHIFYSKQKVKNEQKSN